MAVIITNRDKPTSCCVCFMPKYGVDACKHKEGAFIRYSRGDMTIPSDCPFKSTDDMIAEIEETYIDKCEFNYRTAIDIINKYCKG